MISRIDNALFKKIIVVFWTIWWFVALWSDISGGLAHMGYLNATWARDANYAMLVRSLQMYPIPEWCALGLFIGILAWSLLSAVLFLVASVTMGKERKIWMRNVRRAFIVSLTYWFAFFIADQIIMNFDLEQNHMVQGGFQLLTFIALYLLPEPKSHSL